MGLYSNHIISQLEEFGQPTVFDVEEKIEEVFNSYDYKSLVSDIGVFLRKYKLDKKGRFKPDRENDWLQLANAIDTAYPLFELSTYPKYVRLDIVQFLVINKIGK